MFDLYNGDCFEYLSKLKDSSIDCVVTSPPYNKGSMRRNSNFDIWKGGGIKYDTISDDLDEDVYIQQQKALLDELYRVVKDGGSVFYNHKIRRCDGNAYFPNWALESKFDLHQMIVWDRRSAPDVCNRHLLPTTELIFWLSKGSPKCYRDRVMFNSEVWRINPSICKEHPATFPIEIPDTCIKLTTDEGDNVLDPYNGIGTTGVACIMNNRNYYGSELSKNYYDISLENFESAVEKSSYRVNDLLE